MGSPQLAEAYCDRVYDKALRERVAASAPGSRGIESFLPGHAEPGDYDIYLKLVQVRQNRAQRWGMESQGWRGVVFSAAR